MDLIKEFRMDVRSVDEEGGGLTACLGEAGVADLLGPAAAPAKVHPV